MKDTDSAEYMATEMNNDGKPRTIVGLSELKQQTRVEGSMFIRRPPQGPDDQEVIVGEIKYEAIWEYNKAVYLSNLLS